MNIRSNAKSNLGTRRKLQGNDMNTSSKSFKVGFNDYCEGRDIDTDGVESVDEYMAGYKDGQEQDALAFAGANDHA